MTFNSPYMSIRDWLDGNYNEVECRALEEAGWVAYAAALGSAFSGAWVVTGGALAVNTAIGAAYTLGGCGGDPPGIPDDAPPGDGCQQANGAGMKLFQYMPEEYSEGTRILLSGLWEWPTFSNPQGSGNLTGDGYFTQWDYSAPVAPVGDVVTGTVGMYSAEFGVLPRLYTELNDTDTDNPAVCIDDGPGGPNGPDDPVGPDQPGPEIDGCNWTLTPVDSYVDTNGVFHFKYKVCPDRAECGECFYYWHTQNGPQYISPVAPDPRPPGVEPREVRDCCDETLAKLDEILAKLPEDDDWDWAAILTLLRLIYELLASPPTFGADTYKLEGICEAEDDDGNQPVFSRPVLGGTFDIAALSRLDAMQDLLQAHLAYKTPTCAPERPKLEGDFRTIHFVSDEKTVDGGTRLRKRFRYRSTSGESLGPIVDHWRDFVWQAGPVCVQHAGSSWGTPQIWAASADEGKRVIRHAAGEAGIDPDQNGRWIVGGSNSSRLGMPGTMRVSTRSGVYRITARDGSDGPPMVAIKQYDP